MLTLCDCCGKSINRKKNDLIRFKHTFCSKECRNIFSTKKVEVQCAFCGNSVIKTNSTVTRSTSGNFFCNKSCAASFNNKLESRTRENHPNWIDGTSSYGIFRKDSCERCGYSEHKEILHVHHKDCNRGNCSEDNLETLCPNCHYTEHLFIRTTKE